MCNKGLAPVPGSSYDGGSAPPPESLPPQDYLPTGGAPQAPAQYTIPDSGVHGGNLVAPQQCQCVPAAKCPSYSGGGGGGSPPVIGGGSDGQYDGGQQGGGIVPIVGDKDQNYGGSGAGGGGGHPPTDGSGQLDLRIVNRVI